MEEIKVSIIVPVYNVEKYLERCISSLINQTLKDIEILLIDDGSTDTSGTLCDLYANKDSRIRVIHKNNQGLGFARNTGLDNAKGQYIVFVDSDDFVAENAYENMYNTISSANADMLISNYYEYYTLNNKTINKNTISSAVTIEHENIKLLACQMVGSSPLYKNIDDIGMSVWKNMYLRKFIEDNKIRFHSEREFVSEDAIFHLSIIPLMKKIILVTDNYYYYCQNDTKSLTSTFRESRFTEYKLLFEKELEILQGFNLDNIGKYFIATTFLGNIRNYFKQLSLQNLAYKSKRRIVKDVIKDELVRKILTWYPYNNTSIKQKIFSLCIKYKLINIIIFLARLQANK